jgi:UDP-glucose 4-epimerase
MDFSNSKVLVTGGAGFIGANLANRLLKEGATVTIFDDFSVGSKWNLNEIVNHVTIVKGDVRDFAMIKRVILGQDFVFHMAANASVPISSENPKYDFEVNAIGTLNVLEALRDLGSSIPLVFASSAAVYGDHKSVPPSEESPLRPLSPYGASKLAAEVMCQTFYRTYGLPTICVRFCNVYGPLQRKYVMFDIMEKLQRREDKLEILGTGAQVRDFIYISDAIDACLMLAETPAAFGEVYNVGTGVGTTIKELVGVILDLLGLQNRTKVLYTNESWIGDVERLLADVTRIRRLGFRPKVDLRTGLARFIDWYKSSYLQERRDAQCG